MLDKATKCYVVLPDRAKIGFLALLSFHLSEAARERYVEAGNERSAAITGLRAYNEMIQDVSSQLLSVVEGSDTRPGYPDELLMQFLENAAERAGVKSEVAWAISESFKEMSIQCG